MKSGWILITVLLLVTAAAAVFALFTITADIPALPEQKVASILIVRNPPALNEAEESFVNRLG